MGRIAVVTVGAGVGVAVRGLLLGADAFTSTSIFWSPFMFPNRRSSEVVRHDCRARRRQHHHHNQHHDQQQQQKRLQGWRDRDSAKLPFAWNRLPKPSSCRRSHGRHHHCLSEAAGSNDTPDADKEENNSQEEDVDRGGGSSTSRGHDCEGGDKEAGGRREEGEDGDGDGIEITDDELSGLYGRISELRQRDVELDRVCAYNWRQGTCSHELLFQATDPVQHVACSGDQLAFGTDGGGTWVISRTTGYVANVFEGHFSDVTALFFDGELVITGGADKTVRIQRNLRNSLQNEQLGECTHVLSGHTERVTGVARLGRDRVASSSVDGTLRVWSLETGEVLHELALPAPVYCLGAAEGYLVTGLMDGRVLAWEARSSMAPPRQVLQVDCHNGAVSSLFFPSKDVLVTGGGDGLVKFWDLSKGGPAVGNRYEIDGHTITHTFTGHKAPVCAVQCNDHRIVSASTEGTVSVWDLRSGKQLFQIFGHKEGIRSVQFDREYLITDGTGENLFLHDFTGKRGVPPMIGKSSDPTDPTDPTDEPPFGTRGGEGGGGNPGWGGGGLFGGGGGGAGGGGNGGLEDFPEGDEPGFGRPGGDAWGF